MTAPYMAFHGLILSAVDREGAAGSGGGLNIVQTSGPGMSGAVVYEQGREMEVYNFSIHSTDRDTIEQLIAEVNGAPEDVEFYPFDAERRAIVAKCHATRPKITCLMISGTKTNQYHADITLYCRSDALYGPAQGIPFARDVDLPQAVVLTNEGAEKETLEFLMASGAYDATKGYTADLSIMVGYESVLLCAKMMRDDRFVLDRQGNVEHSYSTHFPKLYTALQTDLHASAHVDYGTGGSCAFESFVLGNSGKLMIPFYGPLQINSDQPPSLRFTVEEMSGEPDVSVAYDSGLLDLEAIDTEPIEIGENFVEVPDCAGHSYVAIGLTTDASSTLELSSLEAICRRYVPEMPYVEPGDQFVMQIGDGEWSNHRLNALSMHYSNNY